MLLLLLALSALSGETRTDIYLRSQICSGDSNPAYILRKELGGSASNATLTNAEFDDLVLECGTSAAACDSEASAILGSFYDNLPESGSDPAKTAFYTLFKDIADAD